MKTPITIIRDTEFNEINKVTVISVISVISVIAVISEISVASRHIEAITENSKLQVIQVKGDKFISQRKKTTMATSGVVGVK